jgi:hypothetical protein
MTKAWANAKAAYKRDGNLDAVLARADMSEASIRRSSWTNASRGRQCA